MKIYIGTDHRGIEIEQKLVDYLNDLGVETHVSNVQNTENDDYPDFAFDICKSVLKDDGSLGILICGTGIGMSIAANKVKGIRAARCTNVDDAYFAKNHNDCNVLCISNGLDLKVIYEIVDTFLNTKKAEEERHIRRVNKIINYENGTYNEL